MSEFPQAPCNIISLFVVDLSYEAPKRYEEIDFGDNAPVISQSVTPDEIKHDDHYELSLRTKVSAKYNNDKDTLFVAEVTIKALVDTTGASDLQIRTFIKGTALDIIYNNAREVINSLILKGNLPSYQLHFVSHEQNFIFNNKEEFDALNNEK